jgi:anti-sigma28 factor (negative regulator of flagellin synthesis)
MKINGNSSKVTGLVGVTDDRVNKQAQDKRQAKSVDTIDIQTATAINKDLSPTKILEEKEARFQKIKEQVQAGTYKIPSSEVLAEKVVQGIMDEIELYK